MMPMGMFDCCWRSLAVHQAMAESGPMFDFVGSFQVGWVGGDVSCLSWVLVNGFEETRVAG